jgi:DNA-binding XRE family transcriptional regulator
LTCHIAYDIPLAEETAMSSRRDRKKPSQGSDQNLGRLIGEVRSMRSMSQAELAQAIGTRQPNVAAWESGRRVPTLETLGRIADQLGVDISIKPGRKVVVLAPKKGSEK